MARGVAAHARRAHDMDRAEVQAAAGMRRAEREGVLSRAQISHASKG